MVIYKKRFLKRCCITVFIRHDLVVTVVSLSLAGLTQLADRGHTAKQKKPLYSGSVAHMKMLLRIELNKQN